MTYRIVTCLLLLCCSKALASWSVNYQSPNAANAHWAKQLEESQRIEQLIQGISQQYQLPFELELQLSNQTQINFDPHSQQLSVPYQSLKHSQQLFEQSQTLSQAEDIKEAVLDSFELQLYQLVAQLMIKNLKLPILGDIHAAANNLATLLLLDNHHQLRSAMILLNSKLKNEALLKQQPSYSGSPKYAQQQQLFNQAVCLVLGYDPQQLAQLPKLNTPELSPQRCQQAYKDQYRAMRQLLAPFEAAH